MASCWPRPAPALWQAAFPCIAEFDCRSGPRDRVERHDVFGFGDHVRVLAVALALAVVEFTAGFGMMAHMAASNAIVQTVVDDDKRAR